jgi:hypothetical protein
MADGSHKALNTVSQGDYVMTPTGNAQVTCVVKTFCTGGAAQLVELPGGLLATPWHPVRVAGQWSFPSDLASSKLRSCTAVYNLVLQRNHPSMLISGVECSVLGHGLKDPVVEHDFFGTDRILEDLKRMPGWKSGLVELVPGSYVRDPSTGRVCGLRQYGVESLSDGDLSDPEGCRHREAKFALYMYSKEHCVSSEASRSEASRSEAIIRKHCVSVS